MDETPPPALPILRGRRVFLRPAERSDIDLFVRWFGDANVARFTTIRAPFSRPMEEQWFERMLDAQGRESYHFVICLRDGGRPIGTIGFFAVDLVNGKAEFGIAIGEKDLWDHGLGSEALEVLVDFGFGNLRLERIYLHVYDYNPRGRRSYEKVGFTLEGTERHAIYLSGAFHDVHLMSMLREEWAAQGRPRSWDLP